MQNGIGVAGFAGEQSNQGSGEVLTVQSRSLSEGSKWVRRTSK
jgi:hypothetical protein